MTTESAYNSWAAQYDHNENKTRDLEAKALREHLGDLSFSTCLEMGCGTGKNTEWLIQRAAVTAVDFSQGMLEKAQEKIESDQVQFMQADMNDDWTFSSSTYDLVTFSLVLEHIQNLDHVFKEVFKVLNPGGYVYIGELHPFKQYTGSKARFETGEGVQVVPCFDHHLSAFTGVAKKYGFVIANLDEYFDNDDRNTLPRLLVLVLQKPFV